MSTRQKPLNPKLIKGIDEALPDSQATTTHMRDKFQSPSFSFSGDWVFDVEEPQAPNSQDFIERLTALFRNGRTERAHTGQDIVESSVTSANIAVSHHLGEVVVDDTRYFSFETVVASAMFATANQMRIDGKIVDQWKQAMADLPETLKSLSELMSAHFGSEVEVCLPDSGPGGAEAMKG